MNKTQITGTPGPSAPLCHLPGAFFKDLQTNFPEIFRACSGMHRSCFTLPVFTKNHPIRALPQPMPATSVGTISSSAVSPYVTLAVYTAAGSLAGLPENSVFQMRSISSAPLSPYVRGRG